MEISPLCLPLDCFEGLRKEGRNEPVCTEYSWIPVMLLESTGVDSPDAAVNAVDRELSRGEPDDRTMTTVCLVNSLVSFHPKPPPQNPRRCYGSSEVGIGNPGERRQEDRIHDKLKDPKEQAAHCNYCCKNRREEHHLGRRINQTSEKIRHTQEDNFLTTALK